MKGQRLEWLYHFSNGLFSDSLVSCYRTKQVFYSFVTNKREKKKTLSVFHTCSLSSASLWALSSSESSVEDSDSDEESLELSEDEAGTMGGWGFTGAAGCSTGAGAGVKTSSGSSGILANRISNTSCRKTKSSHWPLRFKTLAEFVLFRVYNLCVPAACVPSLLPHGLEGCICSSLRTLTARLQQTPVRLCTVWCPTFPEGGDTFSSIHLKFYKRLR